MVTSVESLAAQGFAHNLVQMADTFLRLLRPELSRAEQEYVEKAGPEIVRQHCLHQLYTSSSTLGKEASRQARLLTIVAKRALMQAGVTPERYKLLTRLLFVSDRHFLRNFPLQSLAKVDLYIVRYHETGMLASLKEVAIYVDAPKELRDFLSLISERATALIATVYVEDEPAMAAA